MRILITAGPTREFIDPVRYISNASSGRMGFALAEAGRARGHRVTLVHGPVALTPPDGVEALPVISAADMLNACLRVWERQDALLMTAAVADFTPSSPHGRKIKKSTREKALRLSPTRDILAELAAARPSECVVIGFALEDHNARRNAQAKLEIKQLDAIVLNSPTNIGAERAAVEVLTRGGEWQPWRATTKERLAVRLIRLTEALRETVNSARETL